MRAWLVLLGLAGCDVVFRLDELPPPPPGNHIALVAVNSSASDAAQGPQPSISVTLPGTHAGDLLVAAVCLAQSATKVSVADDQGDSFGPAVTRDGTGLQAAMWFAANTRATQTITITATFSTDALGPDLVVAQYRGIAAQPADGTSLGFVAKATQVTSDPVTTTSDLDVLVAAACVGTEVVDLGGFRVERTTANGNALGDKLTSSTQAFSVTATQSGIQEAIVELAAFKSL